MLGQYLPVMIMFAYTVFTATLFFIPITRFPRKNKLINFYWVGFWAFLVTIAAIAGADNTLKLIGYDVSKTSKVMLGAISASFVFFVMFAWFRLCAKLIATSIERGLVKLKTKSANF